MPTVACDHRAGKPCCAVHRRMQRWTSYEVFYALVDMGLYTEKTPMERAKLLETTALFADVHATEAQSGQSVIPRNLETDYHFTCFVQAPSAEPGQPKGSNGLRLVELDGRRAGPIDRGPSEDLLKVIIFICVYYIILKLFFFRTLLCL